MSPDVGLCLNNLYEEWIFIMVDLKPMGATASATWSKHSSLRYSPNLCLVKSSWSLHLSSFYLFKPAGTVVVLVVVGKTKQKLQKRAVNWQWYNLLCVCVTVSVRGLLCWVTWNWFALGILVLIEKMHNIFDKNVKVIMLHENKL